jgi:CheY-like chemotaxis protein
MRPRILLVEDEGVVAHLSDKLEKLGYEVVSIVSSGEAAVQQADRILPDLALMDIHLEGALDGVEAPAQIRQRCNIPVVFLTAHSARSTLDRARQTAPFGYLIKSYSERELQTTLEVALDKHQLEVELARHTTELERTNAALREKDRLLNAFQAIGRATLSSLDLDGLLDILATQIITTGVFRSLMIALVDQEKQRVEVVRSFIRYDLEWRRDLSGEEQAVKPVGEISRQGDVIGLSYGLDDDNITAVAAPASSRSWLNGTSASTGGSIIPKSAGKKWPISFPSGRARGCWRCWPPAAR